MGKYYNFVAFGLIFFFLFSFYFRYTNNLNIFIFVLVILFIIVIIFILNTVYRIKANNISNKSNLKGNIQVLTKNHSIALLYTSTVTIDKIYKKCLLLKEGNFSEIYIISPIRNDELKNRLAEIEIKFVCNADLNNYNRPNWPRQKGKLESAISYFFDKYSSKSDITTLIYDFVKVGDFVKTDIPKIFADENVEVVLYEDYSNQTKFFKTVENALLNEKDNSFNAISISNTSINKIKEWGQADSPIRNMILAYFNILNIRIVCIEVLNPTKKQYSDSISKVEKNYERILTENLKWIGENKYSKAILNLFFYKLFLQSLIMIIAFLLLAIFGKNYGGIISALLIYETIYFAIVYIFKFDILLSLNSIRKLSYVKYLFDLKDNNIFPVIIFCTFIAISFISLELVLGFNITLIIYLTLILWIICFVNKSITWHNIQNFYKLFKLKSLFIAAVFIIEIFIVYISIVGIPLNSKVSAVDSWIGRVNNQRINLGMVTENAKLTNAAYKKVQYMFLKDTLAHSDPIDAFVTVSGYQAEHTAEIMYVGVGTLEKIFRYWTNKLAYYNQIVNPVYCEAGFWSESREIDGEVINKSVLYLANPKAGCRNATSSSSISTSVSTIISNITSTISNLTSTHSQAPSTSISTYTNSIQSSIGSTVNSTTITSISNNTSETTSIESTPSNSISTSSLASRSENSLIVTTQTSSTSNNTATTKSDSISVTTSRSPSTISISRLTSSTSTGSISASNSEILNVESSTSTGVESFEISENFHFSETSLSSSEFSDYLAFVAPSNKPIQSSNYPNSKGWISPGEAFINITSTLIFSILLILILEGQYVKGLNQVFIFIRSEI